MGRACSTRWFKILDVKPKGKVVLGYVGMNRSALLICAFNKVECKSGYWTGMD
jgi:hypothetical protein